MALWQLGIVAVYALGFIPVGLASGEPEFLIPYAILGALVVAYALAHKAIERSVLRRHGGSYDAAMADNQEPIPSAPDIPDDTRPAGDTPEVPDEINPHDLPADHPGRHAAERQAGEPGGVTRGHREGGAEREGRDLGADEREGARVRR